MSVSSRYTLIAAAVLLGVNLAGPALAQKYGEEPPPPPSKQTDQKADQAPAAQSRASQEFAPVTLSDGTRITNPSAPHALRLTDAQKAQIRTAVDARPSSADFPLGSSAGTPPYKPVLGAVVPLALQGQTFPHPVVDDIPVLKEYLYVKLSDAAVLIDPMNNKVAEIISLP